MAGRPPSTWRPSMTTRSSWTAWPAGSASASDKPVTVREAMRAGALGYVLKNEQTALVRAAIKAVAGGKDWISPRLAYIFATDDAADRPRSERSGNACAAALRHRYADEVGGLADVH